jgi:hypothetical protein
MLHVSLSTTRQLCDLTLLAVNFDAAERLDRTERHQICRGPALRVSVVLPGVILALLFTQFCIALESGLVEGDAFIPANHCEDISSNQIELAACVGGDGCDNHVRRSSRNILRAGTA